MRRYHHIGIPTTEAKPGETHLKHLKLFVVSHGPEFHRKIVEDPIFHRKSHSSAKEK